MDIVLYYNDKVEHGGHLRICFEYARLESPMAHELKYLYVYDLNIAQTF